MVQFLNNKHPFRSHPLPPAPPPKRWKTVRSFLSLHGDRSNAFPNAVLESDARGESGRGEKTEGRFDNGDVGSGDKLLYLLQKWDIRNSVLAVTRIDGGFAQAEILGIRRCEVYLWQKSERQYRFSG